MALKRKFARMLPDGTNEPVPTAERFRADVVSSELTDGRHAPALDLDVPAWLVPSRTEGHSHLYIDVPCTWKQYRKLLKALRDCGIIEPGYYNMALKRRATHLRRPDKYRTAFAPAYTAVVKALEKVERLSRAAVPPSADVYAERYHGVAGYDEAGDVFGWPL